VADADRAVAIPQSRAARANLRELSLLFLRLGLTAFGGPAAHIAIMENEVVRRRQWLSSAKFLDLLGAANLLPGPSSTELAIFIGYEQGGWPGLAIAGVCFIAPAAVVVAILAWVYTRFGALPPVAGVLYGVKPVVIAIVVQALWGLGPRVVQKSLWLGALGLAACVASALGVDALAVLVGGGLASVARRKLTSGGGAAFFLGGGAGSVGAVATTAGPFALFLAFLKIGAVVFGSGYVLLAFLREDLVDRLHWLTEQQLLDAVAVGQVTPGPVFTTATFIGYVVGGGWGALLATVGIFLPGFVLVAASRPILARLRRSVVASAFLDGVNVSAIALMAVVTLQLARSALVDLPTVLVALVALAVLLRFKVNISWLVAGGAAIGATVRAFG
jgi:chromate transporter